VDSRPGTSHWLPLSPTCSVLRDQLLPVDPKLSPRVVRGCPSKRTTFGVGPLPGLDRAQLRIPFLPRLLAFLPEDVSLQVISLTEVTLTPGHPQLFTWSKSAVRFFLCRGWHVSFYVCVLPPNTPSHPPKIVWDDTVFPLVQNKSNSFNSAHLPKYRPRAPLIACVE